MREQRYMQRGRMQKQAGRELEASRMLMNEGRFSGVAGSNPEVVQAMEWGFGNRKGRLAIRSNAITVDF